MTLMLLVAVWLIEQSTAEKIALSRINLKRRMFTELLSNIHYDEVIDLDFRSEQPIDLTSAVSLRSIHAVTKHGKHVAVVLDLVAANGYNGAIRLLVAIRSDRVVLGTRVIDHHETPGLGDKIETGNSAWIDSFRFKSLSNLPAEAWRVKRDGGYFDQFTGATITPRAVVAAIHEGLLFVHSHHQQLFVADQSVTE